MPNEKKDPEGYKEWLENEKKKEEWAKLPLAMRRMRDHMARKEALLAYEKDLAEIIKANRREAERKEAELKEWLSRRAVKKAKERKIEKARREAMIAEAQRRVAIRAEAKNKGKRAGKKSPRRSSSRKSRRVP